MTTRFAADAVLLIHFGFILFVAGGALLVLQKHWLAWLHVPAVLWGVFVELSGRYCPLTALENNLRRAAGEAGYPGGFIEYYIVPLIYPPGLSRTAQLTLAAVLLAINLAAYGWIWWRRRH